MKTIKSALSVISIYLFFSNYTGAQTLYYKGSVVNSQTDTLVKHFGYIQKVYEKNKKHYLDIDFIEYGKESDPSGGSVVINNNPLIRTFEISPNVEVIMRTYSVDSINGPNFNEKINFALFEKLNKEEFGRWFEYIVYTIELQKNIIVKISENFHP